jgi:hypothetical protein
LGEVQPVVLPLGLEPEEPDEPPMFGHGCVVVLVDTLDEGPAIVEWVVVEWFVVAAFATAKPMPMLRPKAPPAKARVVSGLLSFILFGPFLMRAARPPKHANLGVCSDRGRRLPRHRAEADQHST